MTMRADEEQATISSDAAAPPASKRGVMNAVSAADCLPSRSARRFTVLRCAPGSRVAHNVATSQVIRRRRRAPRLVGLDALATVSDDIDHERAVDERRARDRLMTLIRRLEPLERQVILLYLEGLDAASIAEITGLSANNVSTKVHRIKKVLARHFDLRTT
jgi:RNA polymerase sigma factor (sigma-70 family)